MLKLKQPAGTRSMHDVEQVNAWLVAQKNVPVVEDEPCPEDQA